MLVIVFDDALRSQGRQRRERLFPAKSSLADIQLTYPLAAIHRNTECRDGP